MTNLGPLLSKFIEALRGKRFPRRVTAPNGKARWQGSSGRSFETLAGGVQRLKEVCRDA